MKPAPKYPNRAKHGSMSEIVLFAKMNDMAARPVAERFGVSVNSVYRASYRMGVRLKAVRSNTPKTEVA